MCRGPGIFIHFSGHSEALFIWKPMAYKSGKSWIGVRKISVTEIPITHRLDPLNLFFNYLTLFPSFSIFLGDFFNLQPIYRVSHFWSMLLIPQNSSLFSECPIPLLFQGCNVPFYISTDIDVALMLSSLDGLFPSGCSPALMLLLVSVLHAGSFPEVRGDPRISAHIQEWGTVGGVCQLGTSL